MNGITVVSVALGVALGLSSSMASAQQVQGAIAQKYWELGSENSFLGRPVSNEISIPGGGRVSCFERGAITWHAGAGAWPTYPDILEAGPFGEVCRRGNADHLAELGNLLAYPMGDEYTSWGSFTEYGCPRGHRLQLTWSPLVELGGGGLCWNPTNRQVTSVGPAFQGF